STSHIYHNYHNITITITSIIKYATSMPKSQFPNRPKSRHERRGYAPGIATRDQAKDSGWVRAQFDEAPGPRLDVHRGATGHVLDRHDEVPRPRPPDASPKRLELARGRHLDLHPQLGGDAARHGHDPFLVPNGEHEDREAPAHEIEVSEYAKRLWLLRRKPITAA